MSTLTFRSSKTDRDTFLSMKTQREPGQAASVYNRLTTDRHISDAMHMNTSRDSIAVPFNPHLKISQQDINRLFMIWFHSISKDGKTITIKQFVTVFQRIFPTMEDKAQIESIFQNCAAGSSGKRSKQKKMDIKKLINDPSRVFTDIIQEYMQNDQSALENLQKVPEHCKRNETSDAIQKVLCDQVKHMVVLRRWIEDNGLTAADELHKAHQQVAYLQEELNVVKSDHHHLVLKGSSADQAVGMMQDDLGQTVEQLKHLRAMVNTYQDHNDELQKALDGNRKKMSQLVQSNQAKDSRLEDLVKMNEQHKKSVAALTKKNAALVKKNEVLHANIENATAELLDKMKEIGQMEEMIEQMEHEAAAAAHHAENNHAATAVTFAEPGGAGAADSTPARPKLQDRLMRLRSDYNLRVDAKRSSLSVSSRAGLSGLKNRTERMSSLTQIHQMQPSDQGHYHHAYMCTDELKEEGTEYSQTFTQSQNMPVPSDFHMKQSQQYAEYEERMRQTLEAHKRTVAGYERQLETLKSLLHKAQYSMGGTSETETHTGDEPEWIGPQDDMMALGSSGIIQEEEEEQPVLSESSAAPSTRGPTPEPLKEPLVPKKVQRRTSTTKIATQIDPAQGGDCVMCGVGIW